MYRKVKQTVSVIISAILFICMNIVVFIFGELYLSTEWFWGVYLLSCVVFLMGFIGMISPRLMIKFFYNKVTLKLSGISPDVTAVSKQTMSKYYASKVRYVLTGLGILLLLALFLVVYLL
ncbi:MAG: hypothetical protein J1F18_14510 [Lachnospiraceae bacterium]|nr:hypothetical protein [Lachnospiraceae bacterium]